MRRKWWEDLPIYRPRNICFAEGDDDGDGDEDGSGGDGDDDRGGSDLVIPEGGQALVLSPAQIAAIDDKYKAEGTVDASKFVDGYTNLNKMVGMTVDTIREQTTESLRSELQQEMFGQRPENAEAYITPDDPEKLGIPDGFQFTPDPDNPFGTWWRDFCFEKGFGQEAYEAGIKQYVGFEISKMPDYKAEFEKLGPEGEARSGHVGAYFQNLFDVKTDKEGKFVESDGYAVWSQIDQIFTSAEGIKAGEALMAKMGGEPFKEGDGGGKTEGTFAGLSAEEVVSIQNSDAYQSPGHPGFEEAQGKVEAYYKAKNTGKTTRISNATSS